MRVVHICNLPIPPDHPDHGRLWCHPGRWVLNLAKAQKLNTDIVPELVVQVPGARRNQIFEIEGVRVHFLAAPNRLRASTLFYFDVKRISRYIRGLAPDLVHAHGTEESYLLAAQATDIPYLLTAQGCYFIINREMPPNLVSRARIVEFTERKALRRARHVIAKSRYVAKELGSNYPNLKINEIPNTFDERLLDILLEHPREPGSIAFVGTLCERKGVHLIADAMDILKSGSGRPECDANQSSILKRGVSLPILHLFGDRPGNESPYGMEQMQRLRSCLGNRVVFHGTIPALGVAKALSRIELLVAPSIEEMFGNQLIEALLVGCNGIVADGTALAENLRRLETGVIIPQNDPHALADAIRKSLTKGYSCPDAYALRQKILRRMGPSTVAKLHMEVYTNILKETNTHP